MEIVLLRHGKPDIDTSGKVSAFDFGKWVMEYDRAGINDKCKPTYEALERAERCSFTVCSTLPRSIESAEALNIDPLDVISHRFRECEMPYVNWKYPKLSKQSWSMLFRIFQLAGYRPNAESHKAIKCRAETCARQLAELSKEKGSILYIGHGTIIWFIHKQLLRMGWSGPQKAARKYWEYGVYVYTEQAT